MDREGDLVTPLVPGTEECAYCRFEGDNCLCAIEKAGLIDCTCPVVLKLQERVRSTWQRIREQGGQVVIFGKKGHAEVNGLVGQTDSEAIVISSPEDLAGIDFSRPGLPIPSVM